jgi:hypothetical protein
MRGKNKPTTRYLIDQYGERGKATTKKKKTNSTSGNIAGLKSEPCGTPEVGKNRLELNEEFRGRYKDIFGTCIQEESFKRNFWKQSKHFSNFEVQVHF